MPVTGRTPALVGKRVLSVLKRDPRLGILIAMHPPGNPTKGWAVWLQPDQLEAFMREALGSSEKTAKPRMG